MEFVLPHSYPLPCFANSFVARRLVGGFAFIFGRRPVMVASILVFALGSALTGAAQNVPMIIAGRTIQGAGGGGIQTLVSPEAGESLGRQREKV